MLVSTHFVAGGFLDGGEGDGGAGEIDGAPHPQKKAS